MTTRTHPTSDPRQAAGAAGRRREQAGTYLALAAGVALILVAIAWVVFANPYAQTRGPLRSGAALPDFALTDLDGNSVHLSDFQGRPVLINAWAIWCPPCKAEMPLLNQYYQAHQQQGFVLLAINAGDPRADTLAYTRQAGLDFPILLDPGARQLSSLGIDSFPTSILIGRDGKVKSFHSGEFTSASLEAEMSPLLAP